MEQEGLRRGLSLCSGCAVWPELSGTVRVHGATAYFPATLVSAYPLDLLLQSQNFKTAECRRRSYTGAEVRLPSDYEESTTRLGRSCRETPPLSETASAMHLGCSQTSLKCIMPEED